MIVLCGIVMNIGVESIVCEVFQLGYQQIFIIDVMFMFSEEEYEVILCFIFLRIGKLWIMEEFLV